MNSYEILTAIIVILCVTFLYLRGGSNLYKVLSESCRVKNNSRIVKFVDIVFWPVVLMLLVIE